MLDEKFVVRSVRPGDVELICSHRARMFAEAGRPEDELRVMAEFFREWLRPRLEDGRYFGFLVEESGAVVAGIGLMLIDWPPHFLHPTSSQRGYVLNVFVEKEHRGRAIATELMFLAEQEFARRGVSYLVLHASEQGRPVYEKLGWRNTTEMCKKLAEA